MSVTHRRGISVAKCWPHYLVLVAFAFGSVVTHGAAPLPPADAMERSIDLSPEVRAARARYSEAQHEQTLLSLGPYDWTVAAEAARRSVTGDGSFAEWNTALQRPVRLPGKAALDRKIGKLLVGQASADLLVAVRSHRLVVLDAWFACLQAAERARVLEQDREYLRTVTDAVSKRRRAGDLSELDEAMVAAELASATAESRARQVDAIGAARLLATRLEGAACNLVTWDVPATGDQSAWSGALSHRLDADPVMAGGELAAARAGLTAERARRDRWPDPTFSVNYGRERDGAERIGGLGFSVPLGVRRRTAEAARASAAAELASAESDASRDAFRRQWIQLESDWRRARQSWESLAEAERQQRRAAELSQRAFELGEASLSESLQLRRLALQTQLAERAAALEAWRMEAIRQEYSSSAMESEQ